MPDGYRTGRFGGGARMLLGLIAVALVLLVGISLYAGWSRSEAPPRGSAGPLAADTPPPAGPARPAP